MVVEVEVEVGVFVGIVLMNTSYWIVHSKVVHTWNVECARGKGRERMFGRIKKHGVHMKSAAMKIQSFERVL